MTTPLARRRTDYIVVHCSDTPSTMDIGAKEIRQWHVIDNGWKDIGYHYVIRRNGIVEIGRSEGLVGSHVKGFNSNSVGVCMVGGRGGNNFAKVQFDALETLIKKLVKTYDKAEVLGHCDLNAGKTCPSFNVQQWYNKIKES